MINLKLAEYNLETGKFEKFYLFDKFMVSQDFIVVEIENKYGVPVPPMKVIFCKDEKDPLNRFDGLFSGITYGDGRFVSIINNDFEVYETKFLIESQEELGYGINLNGKISYTFKNHSKFIAKYVSDTYPKLIGNLMENPELYNQL